MRKAVSNGRGRNVSAITALLAVSPFSEVHSAVERVKNQWLTNWMVRYQNRKILQSRSGFRFGSLPKHTTLRGTFRCLLYDYQAITIKYSRSRHGNSPTVRRKAQGVRGYSIAECRMRIAEERKRWSDGTSTAAMDLTGFPMREPQAKSNATKPNEEGH